MLCKFARDDEAIQCYRLGFSHQSRTINLANLKAFSTLSIFVGSLLLYVRILSGYTFQILIFSIYIITNYLNWNMSVETILQRMLLKQFSFWNNDTLLELLENFSKFLKQRNNCLHFINVIFHIVLLFLKSNLKQVLNIDCSITFYCFDMLIVLFL